MEEAATAAVALNLKGRLALRV
uniref:Paired amphipathic helix protein Sin3-like 2 n=1 Tax=Rhizophora mucronata TaxID=61149 RepID=A0A2P2NKH6_RHIMU